MNSHDSKVVVGAFIVGVCATCFRAQAGDLNPPLGAIASTNCTQLNQQSASFPITISAPGCYVLTSNLTGTSGLNGIVIQVGDVTLDLNGFAMIGELGASTNGIQALGGTQNIEIRNGTVTGWGGFGIDILSAPNSQLKDLRVANNGLNGLQIGSDSLVTDCTAQDNLGIGMFVAGGSTVINCTSSSNESDGIVTGLFSTIRSCTTRFNTGDGIRTGTSTVSGCTSTRNLGDGIEVSGDSLVVGNTCSENGFIFGDGAGIHVTGANNRIERNNATKNDRGIDVDAAGNLIVGNSASDNTGTGTPSANYDIAVGNSYGEILTSPGANFTNSNPWANFEF